MMVDFVRRRRDPSRIDVLHDGRRIGYLRRAGISGSWRVRASGLRQESGPIRKVKAYVGETLDGPDWRTIRARALKRAAQRAYVAAGLCRICGRCRINLGSKSRCTGCLQRHAEQTAASRAARRAA